MKNSPINDAKIVAINRAWLTFRNYFCAWLVLGLMLALSVARVQAQDDDYLAIYGIILQADDLNANGKTVRAHNKYIEADKALMTFQQNYPGWNSSTVKFRLKYLDEKIAATAPSAMPVAPAPALASDTTVPDSAPPTDAATASSSSPVKLLDAGSEPRQVLTLHPTVGDKESLTMTMKMNMSMSMGGNAMPSQNIPTMVLPMDVTVTDVAADGKISYGMAFGDFNIVADASTPSMTAEAMKTALAGMSGMRGTGKISSKGIMSDTKMQLPPNASPQATQMADQMKDFSGSSVAFPEEAVGPGAKWEYTTQVKSGGVKIDQTTDYELVSIDGDQITLKNTLKQSAANQTIENPAMPGLKINLTSMNGTGTGTATYTLAHIMPQTGTAQADSESVMSLGAQGTMDVKTGISVTIQGK